jgi:hypothetical protein
LLDGEDARGRGELREETNWNKGLMEMGRAWDTLFDCRAPVIFLGGRWIILFYSTLSHYFGGEALSQEFGA